MATAAHDVTPAEAFALPLDQLIMLRVASDPSGGKQLAHDRSTLATALAATASADML